jgi:hypothetical protein
MILANAAILAAGLRQLLGIHGALPVGSVVIRGATSFAGFEGSGSVAAPIISNGVTKASWRRYDGRLSLEDD